MVDFFLINWHNKSTELFISLTLNKSALIDLFFLSCNNWIYIVTRVHKPYGFTSLWHEHCHILLWLCCVCTVFVFCLWCIVFLCVLFVVYCVVLYCTALLRPGLLTCKLVDSPRRVNRLRSCWLLVHVSRPLCLFLEYPVNPIPITWLEINRVSMGQRCQFLGI